MPRSELLRVAWTALRAHKLRSGLTMLGVVMAVVTIVAVMSVISGMDEFVGTKIFSLSPDVYVVTKFGIIRSREEFLAAVKRKDITQDEVRSLEQLCNTCADVGMTYEGSRAVKVPGRRLGDVPVNGTTANVAVLENLDLDGGRYFTDLEEEHSAPVAVIGSEVREELFPRVDPIGRRVWIDDFPYTVIGTLRKQGSVLGQSRDLVVYVPLRTARKQFGPARGPNRALALLVRARGGIPGVPASQDEVTQIFRWLRHTPFRAPDPVSTVTAEMVASTWADISRIARVVVLAISGIGLVVGALVIANIMLVAVIERTREIGLRLSLGARKRDIRGQFLLEAVLLALAGGVLGSLLGAAGAKLVEALTPMPARVRPDVVLAAMAVAALSGLLAGLLPAMKAANLPPIESLRHE